MTVREKEQDHEQKALFIKNTYTSIGLSRPYIFRTSILPILSDCYSGRGDSGFYWANLLYFKALIIVCNLAGIWEV